MASEGFRYLGINFTHSLFHLQKMNLSKLVNDVKGDLCLMEARSCQSSSLTALLCGALASSFAKYTANPIILSSLIIWKQFRQHFGLTSASPHSPICKNHLFLPSSLDAAFASRGKSVSLMHLPIRRLLISLIFVISSIYQNQICFDISKCVTMPVHTFPHSPNFPADTLLEKILSTPGSCSKTSVFYDLILFAETPSLSATKSYWERELGLDLTEEY